MANEKNVLKQMLIGLGFKIDEPGMRRFANTIAIQSEKVRLFAEAIEETGKRLVDFSRKTAESLDQLYFQSRRINESAENLQALGYAAKQAGLDANSVTASVQGLYRLIQTNPGMEAFLNGQLLNVNTRDVKGNARKATEIWRDTIHKLQSMNPMQADIIAKQLGISWEQWNAPLDKFDKSFKEDKDIAKALGLSLDKVTESGNNFESTMRQVHHWFKLLAESTAGNILKRIQPDLDKLAQWFIAHSPQIQKVIDQLIHDLSLMLPPIEKVVKFIGSIVKAAYSWFEGLSDNSKQWVEEIVAAIVLFGPAIATVTAVTLAFNKLYKSIKAITEIAKALKGIKLATGLAGAAENAAGGAAAKSGSWLKRLFGIGGKAAAGAEGAEIAGGAAVAGEAGIGALAWPITLTIGAILGLGAACYAGRKDFEKWREDGDSFFDWGKWLPWLKKDDRTFGGTTPADVDDNYTPDTSDKVKGARGVRNNNPTNLKYVGQAGAHKEDGGDFAVFDDAQSGLNAAASQLHRYFNAGADTLDKLITTWAPAKDKNNVPAYIADVAKQMKVGANWHLNVDDPAVLERILRGIITHENGGNPYKASMLYQAATKGEEDKRKAQVTIHQTNHLGVTAAGNPQDVANAVQKGIDRSTQSLVRNVQLRVS